MLRWSQSSWEFRQVKAEPEGGEKVLTTEVLLQRL